MTRLSPLSELIGVKKDDTSVAEKEYIDAKFDATDPEIQKDVLEKLSAGTSTKTDISVKGFSVVLRILGDEEIVAIERKALKMWHEIPQQERVDLHLKKFVLWLTLERASTPSPYELQPSLNLATIKKMSTGDLRKFELQYRAFDELYNITYEEMTEEEWRGLVDAYEKKSGLESELPRNYIEKLLTYYSESYLALRTSISQEDSSLM